jgi:hypothetical protein
MTLPYTSIPYPFIPLYLTTQILTYKNKIEHGQSLQNLCYK